MATTYWSRVNHFMATTNPMTLLTTDKELQMSISLLQESKTNPTLDPKKVEHAKRITESILHPDTGNKIPIPWRLSAFLPMNLGILFGMLSATSLPSIAFWQVVNQTYNVCMNYANANKSNPLNTTQLATSYLLAVGSSVGTAIGMNEGLKRASISPSMKNLLFKFVPFTAVATANVLNISLMRMNELTTGIQVKDESGAEMGVSIIAGRKAVMETIISRVALVVPLLFIPPLIIEQLGKVKFYQANKWLHTPANLAVIGICMAGGLPLAIALFPQMSQVPAKNLEKKFHDIKDSKGKPLEFLYFNKGL